MNPGDMYTLALGTFAFGVGVKFFYDAHKLTKKICVENEEKIQEEVESNSLIKDLTTLLLEEERDKILGRSLSEFVRVEQIGEPIHTAGRIDYHFRVGEKEYVHSKLDPNSNYLFKPDLFREPISNTFERELVTSAWNRLQRT
jgi:hypothetical protein